MMAGQVRFVHQDTPVDGQGIAELAAFDSDGNPVDITAGGSDEPTTIPQGALIPGDGISLVRDQDSGVITASVKAKGVTAGMLADGVIPTPYTLPAAGTAIGGVKKGAAVAAMDMADPVAAVAAPTKAEYDALLEYAKGLKATLNQLLASLKAAGAIA